MKKTLKIAGVACLTLALAANLQYAVFDFYGIKKNHLGNQLWAQSKTIAQLEAVDPNLATSTASTSAGITVDASGTTLGNNGPVYVVNRQSVTCPNLTANVTYTTTNTGNTGGNVALGDLGSFGISGNSGTTVSATVTINNVQIIYPVDQNGLPMTFIKVTCTSGGEATCLGDGNPCLTYAISQINGVLSSAVTTSGSSSPTP